jgi:hypothetical protein
MMCVDLQERFGRRYRVRREADGATWFETPESERTWLLEIPCRYGVVYPHGDDLLAAAVTSRRVGVRVRRLPCVLSMRGDEELLVTFDVDDAEQVLALLKPYRAHVMTEARRRALAAAQALSPLRLGRDGDGARGREADNGVQIDAAAENEPTPTPEPADAGNSSKGGRDGVLTG